jgi:hypothetical protein
LKYNAPYGNTNEDASYINGNPETGIMGSIPPAESIEYPQREIVNYVNVSGLTPTNSDLQQLAKAVQSGRVNYGVDGGGVNAIAVTPVVPVAAYTPGLRLCVKVSYGNTSSVTVNVSGLGNVPLVHSDLTPLLGFELLAGQLIEIAYDGSQFQMLSGGAPGAAVVQTQPTHLYVSANTGNDTLYDGTSAAPSGSHGGPFKTIQKALATMTKYNLGGWDFYIHVADGVYANATRVEFPRPNGSGTVHLVGNDTNPTACSIFNTGTGSAWVAHNGGQYLCTGFSLRTTASIPGDGGHGIWIMGSTVLTVGVTVYQSVSGSHLVSGPSSFMFLNGGKQTISGGGASHHWSYINGVVYNATPGEPPLDITAPVNFVTAFAFAANGGQCRETWGLITGAGNVTGSRYQAISNGVVDTSGRGASYLPGSTPGSLSTGGQYL